MYFFFLVNQLILLRFLTGIWAKDYLQEEKSLQDSCSTSRRHQHGWQIIKAGSLEDTAQPADSSASQRVTFLGGCLGASSRQFPLVSASAGQRGSLLWEWLFSVFTVCMLLGKEGPSQSGLLPVWRNFLEGWKLLTAAVCGRVHAPAIAWIFNIRMVSLHWLAGY